MDIRINKGIASGNVTAPPSKSYGHRMLICAALAEGSSVVRRISSSEDMLATLDCVAALGVEAELTGDTCVLGGRRPEVCAEIPGKKSVGRQPEDTTGNGLGLQKETSQASDGRNGELPVYRCRESGSTLRFFIPIALALTGGGVFTGAERLMERGIGIYEDLFIPQGISIEKFKDHIDIRGQLKAGDMKVPGNVSSQFISGLLFALPLLKEDSTLEIIPPVESRAYIDITIDAMKLFGVEITETEKNHFYIRGSQHYKPQDTEVEGDWSNAAFLYAIQHLAAERLNILGLNSQSIQGDRVCLEYFDRLLKGDGEVLDISGCPDLGPVLFAFAAACCGGRFTGIRRLRIKESDRARVMAEELAKMGLKAEVLENDMIIPAGSLKCPAVPIDGHNDHRIVMAMAVLLLITGGVISGAEAVRKSYPEFFEVLNSMGIDTQVL